MSILQKQSDLSLCLVVSYSCGMAIMQDALKQAQVETSETLEVQAAMHKLRQEKKQDAKLQDSNPEENM